MSQYLFLVGRAATRKHTMMEQIHFKGEGEKHMFEGGNILHIIN